MRTLSKMMNSTRWLRVACTIAPVAFVSLCGCQSIMSRGDKSVGNRSELTARQQSLADTPLARAANAQKQSRENAPKSLNSPEGKALAAKTGKSQPVQLASAVVPATGARSASKADGVVTAVGAISGGATSVQPSVVPAQHAEMATGGRELDSFSVPREPMAGYAVHGQMVPGGPASVISNPSVRTQSGFQMGQYAPLYADPVAPQVTPQAARVGAIPSHGHSGHNHSGHSCPTCNHGSGAYAPMFPQFHSINGQCPTEGGACPPGQYQPMMDGSYQGYMPPPRQYDPQEHLFDGGDHEPLVRVRRDNSLSGLDPEDTVVQYETVDGETHVESGCRVAIYAPRFASVRKRMSTAQSDFAQRLRTTDRPDAPTMVVEKLPSMDLAQPLKAQNKELVSVAEAIRDRKIPTPAESVLPMLVAAEILQPYADISIFQTGVLKNSDLAKLAVGVANARTWEQVEELNVLVDGQEILEKSSSQRAQGIVIYEHKGARIRLCKVASENLANPGDIISFTIRVDNTGEQPLSNLVITDSLTPRLEFIEGTDKSSLPAKFSTTPNKVGSAVLRWELTEVLKQGDGGVVRFDCRVR